MAIMTVADCIDKTLQLLNQYSIAGSIVPLSYNDQSDTISRMINLINDAQMQMATTVKPIHETLTIEVPEAPNSEPYKDLSFNIKDLIPEGEELYYAAELLFTPSFGHDRRMINASKYKWVGDDVLLLPNRPAGTYTLLYWRFPTRFDPLMTPAVRAETPLDNTPDTHEMIPFFVGAMIALDENPKTYFSLFNEWETRLSRLGNKPPHAEQTQVQDVYNFGGMC